MEMGIVHTHHSEDSTMVAAMRVGEELTRRKWVGDVFTEIRKVPSSLWCPGFDSHQVWCCLDLLLSVAPCIFC